jgi:cysteine-rich repeat protein
MYLTNPCAVSGGLVCSNRENQYSISGHPRFCPDFRIRYKCCDADDSTPAPTPQTLPTLTPTPTVDEPTASPTQSPTPAGTVCNNNGVLDAGEACDDGNSNDGDGCRNCVVEPWHSCRAGGSSDYSDSTPYCKAWRVRKDFNSLSAAESALYRGALKALYEKENNPATGSTNYHWWVQAHLSTGLPLGDVSGPGAYAHNSDGFLANRCTAA